MAESHPPMPAPTRVRTLRPGLHLLETEVPDFDVRGAVLVGAERALVWDTLTHPEQLSPVGELVAGLPVTVVYSHADWDHVWGTSGLGQTAVREVVACDATALRFGGDVQADLERRRASAPPGTLDAVRLVPPTRTFAGFLALELGGVTVELHALPGHTPDCIVGWVPEWGVLLAGDTVETPLPVVNDGAAVPGWIQQLERWAADPRVTSVVPSHGRVGGRELIAETAAYLRGLLAGDPADRGVGADSGGVAFPAFYEKTHARNVERVRRPTPA